MSQSQANTKPFPHPTEEAPTRRRGRRVPSNGMSPDLTPMIDCVFQLIIFFMLTAQMASEQAKLMLPGPKESVATSKVETAEFSGLVINMPNIFGDDPDRRIESPQLAGRPARIQIAGIGPLTVSSHERIKTIIRDRLATARQSGISAENYAIELRVDKDIHWSYVKPLMQAASEAGAVRMVFTARTKTTK